MRIYRLAALGIGRDVEGVCVEMERERQIVGPVRGRLASLPEF